MLKNIMFTICLITILIFSSTLTTIGSDFTNIENKEIASNSMISKRKEYKYLEIEYQFSFPDIETYQNYIIVRLDEADLK